MNVTSIFRQMYWAKLIFFFITGLMFAAILFQVSIMSNGNLNFQYAPCWVGIIITVFLILEIFFILTQRTITVTNKGVEFKYIFFNKSKVLEYETILNIKREKTQLKVKGGPVSDGYHLSVLNLIDGKQEIISPNQFENYIEIINAIKSNFKHEE